MPAQRWTDPIVDEVHEIRRELMAEFGGDLEALVRYLRERQRASGREVVEPPPGPTRREREPVQGGQAEAGTPPRVPAA